MNQKGLAALLGKPQSSVSAYERPKGDDAHVDIPPDAAAKLVTHARRSGLLISFDHIYGDAELPTPIGWIDLGGNFSAGETKPVGEGWYALYSAAQAAQAGG